MLKRLFIRYLPDLIDFAIERMQDSLKDEYESKLDKNIRFLFTDKVSNKIELFYNEYRYIKNDLDTTDTHIYS